MSTRNERYFTTALRLVAAGILTSHTLAMAQSGTQPIELNCENDFGVKPQATLIETFSDGGWFVPAQDNKNINLEEATLPFASCEERVFLQKNDLMFIQLPATSSIAQSNIDWSSVGAAHFRIVRSTPVKNGSYQVPLGQFIETVGWAKIAPKVDFVALNNVKSTKNLKITPLTIIDTNREVLPSDLLLPVACEQKQPLPADSTVVTTEISATDKTARILKLLNADRIGAHSTLFLVDKGQLHGVQLGQNWQLLDTLGKNSGVAKPFGEAVVTQVFDNMSVLILRRSAHEVQEGDLLQLQKPSK